MLPARFLFPLQVRGMPALINCPRLFRLMVRCRVFIIFSFIFQFFLASRVSRCPQPASYHFVDYVRSSVPHTFFRYRTLVASHCLLVCLCSISLLFMFSSFRVFSASTVFHFSSNQDGTRLVLLSALENGGNPRHLLFQKIVRTAPHRTENEPSLVGYFWLKNRN